MHSPFPLSLFLISNIYSRIGRYLLLNAMANQLRYPNRHTHYFSCTILNLFLEEPGTDIIQEQITRFLPHPSEFLYFFCN